MDEIWIKLIPGLLATATAITGWLTTIAKGKKKERIIKVAKILQKLPSIIKAVEESCPTKGSGTIKKLLVLNQCQIECNNTGIEYKEEEWSEEVEKILETPQKKEKTNE